VLAAGCAAVRTFLARERHARLHGPLDLSNLKLQAGSHSWSRYPTLGAVIHAPPTPEANGSNGRDRAPLAEPRPEPSAPRPEPRARWQAIPPHVLLLGALQVVSLLRFI